MDIFDLVLIGVGLAMDAFAVSVCKGLSVRRVEAKHVLICGLYFGIFQALMPLLGYFFGSRFSDILTRAGSWAAFILLAIIGANMIRESFDADCDGRDPDFGVKTMLSLAVATSIDALAVGVGLAAVNTPPIPAAALFGVITFIISGIGVKFGAVFGSRFEGWAERLGGCVLIVIGIKTLLTGLGIL